MNWLWFTEHSTSPWKKLEVLLELVSCGSDSGNVLDKLLWSQSISKLRPFAVLNVFTWLECMHTTNQFLNLTVKYLRAFSQIIIHSHVNFMSFLVSPGIYLYCSKWSGLLMFNTFISFRTLQVLRLQPSILQTSTSLPPYTMNFLPFASLQQIPH